MRGQWYNLVSLEEIQAVTQHSRFCTVYKDDRVQFLEYLSGRLHSFDVKTIWYLLVYVSSYSELYLAWANKSDGNITKMIEYVFLSLLSCISLRKKDIVYGSLLPLTYLFNYHQLIQLSATL